MELAYFIGIDVGTQGARVVLVDEEGQVVSSQQTTFELTANSRQQQDPASWWEAVLTGLTKLVEAAKSKKIEVEKIRAISVTSTSGTVIPLGKDYHPIHPAIMYSDDRSQAAGLYCSEVARQHMNGYRGYLGFNSSSGLSKMVWFVDSFPDKAQRLAHWAHATDYIIGQLSGAWGVTDETNVLKSGYDLEAGCWPDYLTRHLPLKAAWLPEVVPSGTPIGTLDAAVANLVGLGCPNETGQKGQKPSPITVAAGMTDGCASQVASGAVLPGTWNTTIGTTLVIKGVTKAPIYDPLDRLYNHHHPEGYWMPGGASNTGADWVSMLFAKAALEKLEAAADALIPTSRLVYPLLKAGERFPFKAPGAAGFGLEKLRAMPGQHTMGLEASSPQSQHLMELPFEEQATLFAAAMEGTAYIEKMAFTLIRKLSGEQVDRVYTAGGGSNSPTWLNIRSAVLGVPVNKMENVSGAVGAAMLAAARTYYKSLSEAVSKMSRTEKVYLPDLGLMGAYQKGYHSFVRSLANKGYINAADYLFDS